MIKKHLPFIFVLLFASVLLFQLVWENVLLTDDLARVLEADSYNSFWIFLRDFLNSDTMSSRPISGVLYAPSIYFIKYFGLKFYYINYIFFVLSIIIIYKLLTLFINRNLVVFGVFLYTLIPIATSIEFSPIMMNANLATIFYGLSLIFIHKHNREEKRREEKRREEKSGRPFILLSIVSYLFSILSYEVFIPFIFINAYLLKGKNYTKIFYIISLLGLIFGYRQILEPLLFSKYFHRSNAENILDISRNFSIIKDIIFIFLAKLPRAIFRGIRAIAFYNVLDFALLFAIIIFSYFIVFRKKITFNLPKNTLIISFLCFLLSFVIFFVSQYYPSIYDFDNRNLGAVRLFLMILCLGFFSFLSKKHLKLSRIISFLMMLVMSITTISVKNAWLYAYDFNIKLFEDVKNNLPKLPKTNDIYITLDKSDRNHRKNFIRNNAHFILEEPIFYAYWESPYLKKKVRIPKYFRVEYIFHQTPNYSPKSYYLFDYKTKKMEYVQE